MLTQTFKGERNIFMHRHNPLYCIIPPYMLKNIATHGTDLQQATAISSLKTSAQLRGQRNALTDFNAAAIRVAVGTKDRIVYTANNGSKSARHSCAPGK